ncbi:MAG: AAA family ATPase [Chloroflexi bacterium]|nr:AAA family ATPase [Chloroflexota bacterium]
MKPLRLLLLGPPRIERDDQILEPDTRKATALLAYLALSGERPSRDWLAAFLWPDFDESRAKAALRRTLSALKTAVGPNALSATREQIGLNLDQVWCDVSVFQRCLAQDDLATAVSLYRDDFLTGFSLRDSLPFDDWQRMQQETLRRDLAQALARLTQRSGGETAVAHARRWCQLDPLHEDAHRQLMQALAANGRHADALQQYRDCVRILDEELGVPPLPETTALYHAIQNERVTKQPGEEVTRWPGDEVTANGPVTPSPLHPFTSSPLPLVGRGAELARMQQVYGDVGPDGRLLAIIGEVGIGKTRLAEDFVAWAQSHGALTLTARCYEGENNLAYAPIVQSLRDALSQPGGTERLAMTPPYHLAEAARLLPELTSPLAAPLAAVPETPGAQNRFYDGLGQTIAALLHGSAPGVFWLDDVHWLDSASLELLLYLLRRWKERPILILLCWRSEELPGSHSLAQMAAALHRAAVAERTQLARLTLPQVAELVTAVSLPANLPQRLYQETNGLPYFVVEYLRALAAADADQPWPIPSAVRELLLSRLAQVDETGRQLLQTAAAIGHAFASELAQTASGRSEEETVAALENLVARGILVEQTTPAASMQAVYDFSHEKLRALAYEAMGLARRRLLHRRLAETLAESARRQPANTLLPPQIAAHYRLAGKDEEAAAYFVQAGDQARALFAHQDAIHYYRSALALGAENAWRLHAACGELSMRLGAYPDALSSFETAAALAPTAVLSSLEQQLAQVYQRQGEWSLAALTLTQAQSHLDETSDPAGAARLLIDRSLVAHRQKQPQAALAWAQQARTLAETANNTPALALADNILGVLARSRGELETAVTLLEQSRRLAEENGRLDIQIAAGNNLALTLMAAGQLTAARENLEQALILCQRLGDRHHEAALRSNLADVLHQAGDEAAAQAQIRQSAIIYADIGREQEMWRAEIWQLMEW